MRRRWHYWRRRLRANRWLRTVLVRMCLILVIYGLWGARENIVHGWYQVFEEYGVWAAGLVMETWFSGAEQKNGFWNLAGTEVFSYLKGQLVEVDSADDPAYERILAAEWENRSMQKALEAVEQSDGTDQRDPNPKNSSSLPPEVDHSEAAAGEVIAKKAPGFGMLREKLADYDYLIQNFYSIHPTTTADRNMMKADLFLSMDLSIEKTPEKPQILIYHTHSQEEFADFSENPEATIVGVGVYLEELLEQAGYQVIHDTSVYDVKDGKLDRSQAYTYALEGITKILQKNPSIEVVLDLHRDGVDENTRLVTEVNGKQTAKIMFFNGTSQTPDGPIEYLPNPNRDANMAFSFQMHLLAAEQYPGLTRKIYLKGLRYNQHVRARTALVEVGAQTNTYAEALNAMEPLAELLCQVLEGDGSGS